MTLFLFDPSGPDEGNQYNDFHALFAAAKRTAGPVTIFFLASCSLPAGLAALFPNPTVTLDAAPSTAERPTRIVVTAPEGFKFGGVTRIRNLTLISTSSSALFDVSSLQPSLNLEGYAQLDCAAGAAPMFAATEVGDMLINLYQNSGIGELSGQPVMTTDATGVLQVSVYDSAFFAPTAFAGDASNFALNVASTAVGEGGPFPPGVFPSRFTRAAALGYDDAKEPSMSLGSTVQEALDAIKTRAVWKS